MTGLITYQSLGASAAQAMMHAALEEAHRLGAPSGIAIVDARGVLLAWTLMDGATPLACDLVPNKARSAVFSGLSTGSLPAELSHSLATAIDGFVDLPGGIPVLDGDAVLGAAAAGGPSHDGDVAVATAAVAAVAGLPT